MMASNPKWCLSLQEWKNQFSDWILTPTNQNIMHCNIFFDFRSLYGEAELSKTLGEHIFDTIDQKGIFLSLLAKNALQNPPPLTFFRNFMVEKNGEHKDAFDIKSRAMMPLTDAARLLILGHQVTGINNTFKRFEKLAELEPNYRELYEQAADAYEILIRYRALQGLKNSNSGKFLLMAEMTKMQKLNLRNTFRPISELQDIIKIRYQVSFFN
jgi:CBS domain-containing protein